MRQADLKRITEESIDSAGPRYTPAQDARFPNLSIADLNDAFIGIIGGKPFTDRVLDIRDEISKGFDENKRTLTSAFPGRFRKPNGCVGGLTELATCRLGGGKSTIHRTRRALVAHLKTCDAFQDALLQANSARRAELQERQDAPKEGHIPRVEDDAEIRKIDGQLNALRKYTAALYGARKFLFSAGCEAQYNNATLIVGEWGSGKTHYLCDIARHRISEGKPTLLLLAKDFEPHPNVCAGLVGHARISRNITSLVNGIGRLARNGERALLIIDGVNESDSAAWKRGVAALIEQIHGKDNVALILSSRSPMHFDLFRPSLRKHLLRLTHPGFSEIEFDAQQSFFDFYDIPLPEVPLLADEFSRPLALKILCEAFQELPKKTQRAGFAGLSSGQRGMTQILERFINRRAQQTETIMQLPARFCWGVIKGDNRILDPLLAGLGPHMAATRENYVPKDIVFDIIEARAVIPNRHTAEVFYRRILAEGILIETELWRPDEEGGSIPVIRMPYERFSDHIIARHILARYLDVSSEKTVRRSLYKNTPLGSIFASNRECQYQYKQEGWAEAIIIEFPERVKRTLPKTATELYFYLPKAWRSINAYWRPFCSGLFWRHPDSFSKQTDRITGWFLWQGSEVGSRKIIDALIAVATKPKHPYSGSVLYRNLDRAALSDRDLLWSEYLRTRYNDSSADRLVNWFERPISTTLKAASARNLIAIFSLFLTSTDRKLRDRVTKVLVRLGERFPKGLMEHTLETFSFNDPYVPERMLAACYGVAMSLWSNPSNRIFRRELPKFAKQLVRRMYLARGDFRTPHVLMREYSTGIIELAQLVHPHCIATQWIGKARPPFQFQRDPFSGSKVGDSLADHIKGAIQMDFGNYTIGRLIPGRRNYDDSHPEYVEVRRKIERRIYEMGYRQKIFKNIDRDIGRRSWYQRQGEAGKVDRYGKKYAWIAYFEMYGLRQAKGLLSDHRQEERTSDCDIDPSFPKRPPAWVPPRVNYFRGLSRSDIEWLRHGPSPRFGTWIQRDVVDGNRGPWVLLDGYFRDEDAGQQRLASAFLRGFLVRRANLGAFRNALRSTDHPGSGLPDPVEVVYTYAGEIPWARQLLDATEIGKAANMQWKPQEAFSSSRRTPQRKRVKRAWRFVYEHLGEIPNVGPIRIVPPEGESDPEKAVYDAISAANSRVQPADRIDLADLSQKKPTADEVKAGYWIVEKWQPVPGIPVYPTSWCYGWESYHSVVNDFSGFQFPAPQICKFLNLSGRNRGIELFDDRGMQATLYRGSREDWSKAHEVLYLRQDLLEKVLAAKDKALVWVIWGERNLSTRIAPRRTAAMDMLRDHEHNHKRFVVFQSNSH